METSLKPWKIYLLSTIKSFQPLLTLTAMALSPNLCALGFEVRDQFLHYLEQRRL